MVRAAPDVRLAEPFTVLGIETSCDDTGVAIVRSDGTILGEAVASQAALHEVYGGVMPSVARDAHVEALDRTIALAAVAQVRAADPEARFVRAAGRTATCSRCSATSAGTAAW